MIAKADHFVAAAIIATISVIPIAAPVIATATAAIRGFLGLAFGFFVASRGFLRFCRGFSFGGGGLLGRLGRVGLWFVWSEVLPALGILEGISLWTRTAMVAGEATRVPVTLADLSREIAEAIKILAEGKTPPKK